MRIIVHECSVCKAQFNAPVKMGCICCAAPSDAVTVLNVFRVGKEPK